MFVCRRNILIFIIVLVETNRDGTACACQRATLEHYQYKKHKIRYINVKIYLDYLNIFDSIKV